MPWLTSVSPMLKLTLVNMGHYVSPLVAGISFVNLPFWLFICTHVDINRCRTIHISRTSIGMGSLELGLHLRQYLLMGSYHNINISSQ
jgi:hypothetical protein